MIPNVLQLLIEKYNEYGVYLVHKNSIYWYNLKRFEKMLLAKTYYDVGLQNGVFYRIEYGRLYKYYKNKKWQTCNLDKIKNKFVYCHDSDLRHRFMGKLFYCGIRYEFQFNDEVLYVLKNNQPFSMEIPNTTVAFAHSFEFKNKFYIIDIDANVKFIFDPEIEQFIF